MRSGPPVSEPRAVATGSAGQPSQRTERESCRGALRRFRSLPLPVLKRSLRGTPPASAVKLLNKTPDIISTMNTTRESRLVIVLLLSCITVLVAGCRPRPSANEKRYPIKGKIVAVDKTDRTATIEHEDIVGYMTAMTIPFKIKNDAGLGM